MVDVVMDGFADELLKLAQFPAQSFNGVAGQTSSSTGIRTQIAARVGAAPPKTTPQAMLREAL